MTESAEDPQSIEDTLDPANPATESPEINAESIAPAPNVQSRTAIGPREALARIDAMADDLRRRYEAGEVDLDHVLKVTRALAAERARFVGDRSLADDRGRRRPPFDRFVIALGAFCRFYIASEYDPED